MNKSRLLGLEGPNSSEYSNSRFVTLSLTGIVFLMMNDGLEQHHSVSVEVGPSINIDDGRSELKSSTSSTWSSLGRAIKRKLTNFSLVGYAASFLFAAVLTLGLISFCLWIIYLDFKKGAVFSISGWAQTVIVVLIGAWITDRPKFLKESSSSNHNQVPEKTE